MKAIKILAWTLFGITLVMAGLGSYTWIDRETRTYDEHKTFAGDEVSALEVDAASTDLHLGVSTDDSVHLDFVGNVTHGGFGGGEYELFTSLQGEVLKVELKRESVFQIGLYDEHDLRLDIRLPEKLYRQLAVTTSSGDIQTAGLNAESMLIRTSSGDLEAKEMGAKQIKFTTASGDQRLQTLSGEMALESSSGEIVLRTWTGSKAEVRTSSGDQRLQDMTGGVHAHSSSGDVRLAMSALQEELDLLTSSGDVELEFPDSAFYQLAFNTSSGSSAVDFPLNVKSRDDHQLVAEIGDGGPAVRVETSSGDLSIIKR